MTVEFFFVFFLFCFCFWQYTSRVFCYFAFFKNNAYEKKKKQKERKEGCSKNRVTLPQTSVLRSAPILKL